LGFDVFFVVGIIGIFGIIIIVVCVIRIGIVARRFGEFATTTQTCEQIVEEIGFVETVRMFELECH
jgi:hypothetical protein